MCLVLLGHQVVPGFPLVLVANRDEFYERSTSSAHNWEEAPHVMGGRDLEAGGTWMGVGEQGRFAVVTNYRKLPVADNAPRSRGDLVYRFLAEDQPLDDYLEELRSNQAEFQGYNLILGEGNRLAYFSNRGAENPHLPAGWHGLSNHLLNTPWPKVQKGKEYLQKWALENDLTNPEPAFEFLQDQQKAPDDQLPETGIGKPWEQVLSSLFIESERYGTRCSSILLVDQFGKVTFRERSYVPASEKAFQFSWPKV